MRFQLFSDLHYGVAPVKQIRIASCIDAVVVPGDVCEGSENAFTHLRSFVPHRLPIVFVMGNHESYGRFLPREIEWARSIAPRFGISFLERQTVEIAGVLFAGATTWTDYSVFGEAKALAAMAAARRGMNDHRRIGWQKNPWKRFRPEEALLLHKQTKTFLKEAIVSDKPVVVVSHHAPSFQSVAAEFENDLLTAAFASNIAHDLVDGAAGVENSSDVTAEAVASAKRGRIDVWCHGHTHNSVDYRIGNGTTRVIANPHGYGEENAAFAPELVVEVVP